MSARSPKTFLALALAFGASLVVGCADSGGPDAVPFAQDGEDGLSDSTPSDPPAPNLTADGGTAPSASPDASPPNTTDAGTPAVDAGETVRILACDPPVKNKSADMAAWIQTNCLSRAMAMSSSGNQVAVIGGPAVAGLLFLDTGSFVYGAAALLLAVSLVFVLGLHDRRTQRLTQPPSLDSMLAGVRFIWARKPLLGAVSLDLMAVLFGGATALLPIYAKDILHVGPQGLGALRAAPAAGALVASLLLTRFPIRNAVGRWLLLGVAAYGLCMLAFGVSRSFALSLAVLALSGVADMVSVVVRQTLVQLDTPDDMRGRVGAVNSMFIGASNQLGEFESGATAAWFGPVGSVVLGGVATLVVVAAWWRIFPTLARRRTFHA